MGAAAAPGPGCCMRARPRMRVGEALVDCCCWWPLFPLFCVWCRRREEERGRKRRKKRRRTGVAQLRGRRA